MFKVIDGGLSEGSANSRKKFKEAYMTNTRLMGVVGISVHWELIDNTTNTEFYQVFYLDAEEYGFDSYECVVGPLDEETEARANALADRLMGGLGGTRVEINEREARSLVQEYVFMNSRLGIGIPDEAEIDFIMRPEVILSIRERNELMQKQCEEIISDYQLINYFMMRCVGHDINAARYLTDGSVTFMDFMNDEPATLTRNESELSSQDMAAFESGSFSTTKVYLCQSLVEHKAFYEVITSKITVENLKVTGFEVATRERISLREANLLIRREEYILLDEFEMEPEEFTKDSSSYTRISQESEYETGRLFMIFNPDNSHVLERVYRLFDDVFGTIFVSNFGQILISSFKKENMLELDRDIRIHLGKDAVFPVARYNFDMPVLYEFVKSGFPDFEDFVDAISTDSPEQ
ncbi:MAG: hypothetical protein IKS99_06950 [Firmicutes bacterium]|nr:hypothetical protein [Bacillota bacterium]